MKQNEIALLALIANNPGLRTAQIADRLDVTVDEVETLLRPHLVAGRVFENEVMAPNNRPAMAYDVSEQFKVSDAYRAVLGGQEPGSAQVEAAQPGPTASSATPQAPAEVEEHTKTRVERAIACVTEHGRVTNDQLRFAMGLRVNQFPTSFLNRVLRDGLLARDGDNWVLGPALAAEPEAKPASLASSEIEIPKFTEKVTPEVRRDPAPVARTGFRCAIWSDGILELQRDGATIAALSACERSALAGLLQQAAH
jgi:hypothetical protein